MSEALCAPVQLDLTQLCLRVRLLSTSHSEHQTAAQVATHVMQRMAACNSYEVALSYADMAKSYVISSNGSHLQAAPLCLSMRDYTRVLQLLETYAGLMSDRDVESLDNRLREDLNHFTLQAESPDVSPCMPLVFRFVAGKGDLERLRTDIHELYDGATLLAL